jgi:hypothetical protein
MNADETDIRGLFFTQVKKNLAGNNSRTSGH